jgi:hypothetical protein
MAELFENFVPLFGIPTLCVGIMQYGLSDHVQIIFPYGNSF